MDLANAGWALSAIIPVLLASFGLARKFGALEQKVDGLHEALNSQTKANVKVLDSLVSRLEEVSEKLSDHTVQDARNFGEIRGMLRNKN
jgi:hypothetical protein